MKKLFIAVLMLLGMAASANAVCFEPFLWQCARSDTFCQQNNMRMVAEYNACVMREEMEKARQQQQQRPYNPYGGYRGY